MSGALPKGWTRTTIEKVLAPLEDGRTLHHGWSPQCLSEPSPSSDVWGVLKTTAIQQGRYLPEHNKRLPDSLKPRPQLEVKAGDLLLTCAGPRVRCGVPCLVRETRPRLILSGKMYRFRVRPDVVDPRFLEAQLLSSAAQAALDAMKTGISDSGLNLTHDRFKQLPTILAPLHEQRQVVAAIDAHFSRLDAATATLERVQRKLERYRASVLKAAVEGRLVPTEAELARKEGRSYEPASVLLKRILAERRRRWEEAELAELKAKGKAPTDDRWKARYVEPVERDTAGLPDLPEGWCWTHLGTAFEVSVGATPSRARAEYWGGDIPWVSSGEVAFCRIRATRESITKAGLENSSTKLNPAGTVLIGMIGEGRTRGQVAILDVDACNNQNAAAVRVSEAGLSPEFVYHYLVGAYQQNRSLGSGNNQPALNKTRVQTIPLPLAPLAEQRRIASALEGIASVVDHAGVNLAATRDRIARLRQSILKRAFEGRLVNAEPGGVPSIVPSRS